MTTAAIKEKTDDSVTVVIAGDIKRATAPLETWKTHEAINKAIHLKEMGVVLANKLEACCDYSDDVVKSECGFHPLMAAAHLAHEGKEKIIVKRDDFIRLSPENPWQEVFSAFTDKIKEFVGEANYGSMVQKFSTTTPVEQAAFEVALMDGMQSYFSYEFQTMCTIPEVTLKGTSDDWKKILGALRSQGLRLHQEKQALRRGCR